MNTVNALPSNPFAMMLAPQQVFEAIEGSSALRGLRQKQYMLLDRPAIESAGAALISAQDDEDEAFDVDMMFDEPLLSESVSGSHTYHSFPRVFD